MTVTEIHHRQFSGAYERLEDDEYRILDVPFPVFKRANDVLNWITRNPCDRATHYYVTQLMTVQGYDEDGRWEERTEWQMIENNPLPVEAGTKGF
jgi:hypothetical protein